jgi:hypothetical protein
LEHQRRSAGSRDPVGDRRLSRNLLNCERARAPAETAICGNAQFAPPSHCRHVLRDIGSRPPAATLEQVKRSEVKACGADFNCIVSAHISRIMFLKQTREQPGL